MRKDATCIVIPRRHHARKSTWCSHRYINSHSANRTAPGAEHQQCDSQVAKDNSQCESHFESQCDSKCDSNCIRPVRIVTANCRFSWYRGQVTGTQGTTAKRVHLIGAEGEEKRDDEEDRKWGGNNVGTVMPRLEGPSIKGIQGTFYGAPTPFPRFQLAFGHPFRPWFKENLQSTNFWSPWILEKNHGIFLFKKAWNKKIIFFWCLSAAHSMVSYVQ